MKSPSSVIPFVKASACGNDFLVIDGDHFSANLAELTRALCDRHSGIGADGVEWLFPDPVADTYARLFNADGFEAEISGNGTRCVAAHLCSVNPQTQFVIRTGAGLKTCVLTASSGTRYEFETAMGEPQIGGEVILALPTRQVRAISISMGNPHLSIFVAGFSSSWQAEAAEIVRHANFPQGVNIEFVKIADDHNIEVRFFERGVGETQSSGTGSCAAAVAAIFASKAASPVRVHATGGTQSVRWEQEVFLRGPAQLVAQGEYFPPDFVLETSHETHS
jgi:diaminopimelate epimerase